MKKNICPVCGREKEHDEYTCRRCHWCDDDIFLEPNETGGANGDISFNEAKQNAKKGLDKRGNPFQL